MAKESATSTPLPARLILVSKQNVHGRLARKKARIVICGNFQDVRPDEFTASKTPGYPSLRMALSALHMGRLSVGMSLQHFFMLVSLATETTDLGGNEIFMRPPKILVKTDVVSPGVVWKIKKALYGLRTSPIACERDNTLKALKWFHNKVEYRLLPSPGSPCLCRPGDDPHNKTSGEDLTEGVVITFVDDLLLTGWQHHVDAIARALLEKYVMKRSGSLPYSEREGIDFLGARITRNAEGTVWCDQSKYILYCLRENGFIGVDGRVSLRKSYTPPSIDEKLVEEEGTLREKNNAMAVCRK